MGSGPCLRGNEQKPVANIRTDYKQEEKTPPWDICKPWPW